MKVCQKMWQMYYQIWTKVGCNFQTDLAHTASNSAWCVQWGHTRMFPLHKPPPPLRCLCHHAFNFHFAPNTNKQWWNWVASLSLFFLHFPTFPTSLSMWASFFLFSRLGWSRPLEGLTVHHFSTICEKEILICKGEKAGVELWQHSISHKMTSISSFPSSSLSLSLICSFDLDR